MRTLIVAGLASALLGGSVGVASAQSTSKNWMNAPGGGGWSSATHCLDRVTQQPRLKEASAAPSGATGSNTAPSTAPPSGSTSGSASGSAGSASGSTAGLQPCD